MSSRHDWFIALLAELQCHAVQYGIPAAASAIAEAIEITKKEAQSVRSRSNIVDLQEHRAMLAFPDTREILRIYAQWDSSSQMAD